MADIADLTGDRVRMPAGRDAQLQDDLRATPQRRLRIEVRHKREHPCPVERNVRQGSGNAHTRLHDVDFDRFPRLHAKLDALFHLIGHLLEISQHHLFLAHIHTDGDGAHDGREEFAFDVSVLL